MEKKRQNGNVYARTVFNKIDFADLSFLLRYICVFLLDTFSLDNDFIAE